MDLLVVAGGTSQERTHSAVAVIGAVLDNVTRRNWIAKAAARPNGIQQNR